MGFALEEGGTRGTGAGGGVALDIVVQTGSEHALGKVLAVREDEAPASGALLGRDGFCRQDLEDGLEDGLSVLTREHLAARGYSISSDLGSVGPE